LKYKLCFRLRKLRFQNNQHESSARIISDGQYKTRIYNFFFQQKTKKGDEPRLLCMSVRERRLDGDFRVSKNDSERRQLFIIINECDKYCIRL